MRRFTLIILSLLCFVSLCAQTYPDIYDTLDVVLNLQGWIGYWIGINYYQGGVSSAGEIIQGVGDSYDQWAESEVASRCFLSFPVINTPAMYTLHDAVFSIMETDGWGNGAGQSFPIWTNGNYHCMLAHVDYGNSLELEDFNPTVYNDVGVLTSSYVFDYVSIPVTNAYLMDLTSNRQYSQYMMYFHILTDYDYLTDLVIFANGNHPAYPPRLVLHYVSTIGSVTGQVADAASHLPIAGATVSCDTLSVTTNANGEYTLDLPCGEHLITCTDSLHMSQTQTVNVLPNQWNLLNFVMQGVANDDNTLPNPQAGTISLCCYPNPFSSQTKLSFILPQKGNTTLFIYNTKGQRVRTLLSASPMDKGYHDIVWNGKDESGKLVGSGVYLLKVASEGESAVAKLMVVR